MADDADEKDKGPAIKSAAWYHMSPKWAMIRTLLAGTDAMRAAGLEYLPQHPGENDPNYKERLAAAVLFNMTSLTLEGLVGKPFSEPMQLNDDVPAPVKAIAPNIDLQGNDVSVFCRAWLREGIAKALGHVYIDMPPLKPRADGKPRTLEDDNKENRRPYWNHICPENVIFMAARVEDGKEVLTHIRFVEQHTEVVGWEEVTEDRIRVLEIGKWSLWAFRETEDAQGKKTKKWVSIESGETGLKIIPWVTFYADHDGLMRGKPPMEDLAHLNVSHWQSSSDQRNVLTVARFPMLAVSGISDQAAATMLVGPRQVLSTKNEQGRFYYVEHTGAAIAEGWKDLADLEQQMSNYGAEFLRKKPGNQTATGRALDSAESVSPLLDMVNRFKESVAQALAITALWLKIKTGGGTVKLNTDFTASGDESTIILAIIEAYKEDAFGAEVLCDELRRRNVLSEETKGKTGTGKSSTAKSVEDKRAAEETKAEIARIAAKNKPKPAAK